MGWCWWRPEMAWVGSRRQTPFGVLCCEVWQGEILSTMHSVNHSCCMSIWWFMHLNLCFTKSSWASTMGYWNLLIFGKSKFYVFCSIFSKTWSFNWPKPLKAKCHGQSFYHKDETLTSNIVPIGFGTNFTCCSMNPVLSSSKIP